ncbi:MULTISPECIES: hypothetical protein [unclassified Pseudomonas]|uniref:hypothetical protein n=1 Tax=unclassified Pseudomonas TaxID=196821 RepID=UPI001304C062|nr:MULTISPECIES: hypothetical protein [unclassified Pseudomonas]
MSSEGFGLAFTRLLVHQGHGLVVETVGMCTSPKLIAPFQIARAMVVYSRVMFR